MKKKQRDDVMGEDESSLPINDGELGIDCDVCTSIADILRYSARWVPRLPVQEGVFLPVADKEC